VQAPGLSNPARTQETAMPTPRPIRAAVMSALAPLALAGALCGAVPPTAYADTIAWKHTHFMVGYQGTMYLRRGAAFFADGQVATLEIRGANGPRDGSRQPFDVYLTFRFDDGSQLNARMQGGIEVDAYGGFGDQQGRGEFVGGTGRWQGATGAFTMSGRGGLSPTTEGVMADVVAECAGTVKVAAR
jgi:hypothetical protein